MGDSFIGFPREIHMVPEKYLLLTRCLIGNQYALPSVPVDAAAGMTDDIRCEPITDHLGKVKASVFSSEKTPSPNKQ